MVAVDNERNDSDDEFYDCDEDEQQQQNIVNEEGDESECPIYIFSIVLLTTIYVDDTLLLLCLTYTHYLFFVSLSTTNYLSLQILAFNHRGRPLVGYRNSAQ